MRPLPAAVLRGAGAGLVAGLLLTTAQALARLLLGVAPPAELIGDRIAPLLSINQFFGLFAVFGGYNGLKQVGVGGTTAAQLAVGVLVGVGYALLTRRAAGSRRPLAALAAVAVVVVLLLVAGLWPNLSTSFVGLPSGPARALTIAVTALGFALFAVAVAVLVRVLGGGHARTVGSPGPGTMAAPERPPRAGPQVSLGRRALLVGGLGVGLAAATYGMGAELFRRATFSYDGTRVLGPTISPITPNERFYTVTKNVVDPRVDAGLWRFTVDGAVGSARTWTLDDLRAMPRTTQETTLMCISNGVGDGLESNAMWTGVPLADLITAAQPSGRAVEVLLSAVDGYTDTFSIDKAMDPTTLLAFEMNGEDLPQRHGYPARLVVPGMYGEKNLKWISKVEVVTEEAKGFYENQGWGPDFVIPTRSRFVSLGSGGQVRRGDLTALSGTAFGGNRGVARVEVSADGGRTWTDARITYPGTELTWALWSYDWRPAAEGRVTLAVRATDRTGAPQTAQERGVVPTGATGYHKIQVTVV